MGRLFAVICQPFDDKLNFFFSVFDGEPEPHAGVGIGFGHMAGQVDEGMVPDQREWAQAAVQVVPPVMVEQPHDTGPADVPVEQPPPPEPSPAPDQHCLLEITQCPTQVHRGKRPRFSDPNDRLLRSQHNSLVTVFS